MTQDKQTTIHMPLINGWTYMHELIIPDCPLCGETHRHSNTTPERYHYQKGERTTRVPHCSRVVGNRKVSNICIEVQGDLTNEEYRKAMRHYGKPSLKRTKPVTYTEVPLVEIGMR